MTVREHTNGKLIYFFFEQKNRNKKEERYSIVKRKEFYCEKTYLVVVINKKRVAKCREKNKEKLMLKVQSGVFNQAI